MKYFFKILTFIILLCFFKPVKSQVLYSLKELDTVKTFTNLSEALLNPEKVIKLELKGKKNILNNEDIPKFKNLQSLTITKTGITAIANEIAELKFLQELDLSNNSIEEIPVQLTNSSNLIILKLGQNKISKLPPEISNLQKLKHLDLWSNEIEDLPVEMQKMSNLIYLDLRVILFSQDKQNELQELLPWVKMKFSYSCNCN